MHIYKLVLLFLMICIFVYSRNSKIINPLLAIHQEREKERQKERDRERYVIMRQSQRHSLQQNQSQTQAVDENIYENCGQKRNVIHGVNIPPF